MGVGPDLEENSVLHLRPHVTVQEFGGSDGGVILNLRTGEMYSVNETGVAFLQKLGNQNSVAAIADQLVETFDVSRDVLIADLIELGGQLLAEDLLSVG